MTILSRRGFLAGLIAAPAILKLGIHMPVKPVLDVVEPEIVVPEPIILPPRNVTLLVPEQFGTIRLAMEEARRMTLDASTIATLQIAEGHQEVPNHYAGRSYVANPGLNRKARRRMAAAA
jgi:hypothetical protein